MTIYPVYCRGFFSSLMKHFLTTLRIPSAPTTRSASACSFFQLTSKVSSIFPLLFCEKSINLYHHCTDLQPFNFSSNCILSDWRGMCTFFCFDFSSLVVSFFLPHSPITFPSGICTKCLVVLITSLSQEIPKLAIALLACWRVSPYH